MGITHKPKAGSLLTGAEYEAEDSHNVELTAADVGAAADDHTHDYEAAGAVAAHAEDADPHTGYRKESDDHTHASTGVQGGKLSQANTHESPDTDTGASSLHHTIGTGANQAAAGNHTHSAGAPADADYLVGTANGSLSNEIVVGTSPGGELGGTWASPTVDATHSGSSHAGVVSAHEALSDPHTGYVLESLLDAKGDLIAASADNTPAKVTVGANNTLLQADSGQTAGVKWTALGFGVTSGLAVSLTTASALATATTSISAATYADVTGVSVTLAAGTWLVLATCNGSSVNAHALMHVAITHSDNTVQVEGSQGIPASGSANVASNGNVHLVAILSPASSTTYKMRAARGNTTLTGTWVAMDGAGVGVTNNLTDNTDKGTGIWAVRIA